MNLFQEGEGNLVDIDNSSRGNSRIVVNGSSNIVRVGSESALNGGVLEIRGHRSSIVIGDQCKYTGNIIILANDAHIRIGNKTTAMGARIYAHETGEITIGNDCMFSSDVYMNVSDVHSIFNAASGDRINQPADIIIGDHVWLCRGATIGKGSQIGSGSVVGGRCFVQGLLPANCLAVGSPARIARRNIMWARERVSHRNELSYSHEDILFLPKDMSYWDRCILWFMTKFGR